MSAEDSGCPSIEETATFEGFWSTSIEVTPRTRISSSSSIEAQPRTWLRGSWKKWFFLLSCVVDISFVECNLVNPSGENVDIEVGNTLSKFHNDPTVDKVGMTIIPQLRNAERRLGKTGMKEQLQEWWIRA